MKWIEFLERREARRRAAAEAARALEQGRTPELPGWRFGEIEGWSERVRDALRGFTADLPRGVADAVLAPADELPRPAIDEDLAEQVHRRALVEALRGRTGTVAAPPAWALAELLWLGQQIDVRERAAWVTTPFRADARLDASAAALWASWFAGDPWNVRRDWDRLYLPAVTRVFRGVLESRRVPPDTIGRATTDLREAFFFAMLTGERPEDAPRGAVPFPGWADAASRVVETGGAAPGDELARLLGARGWEVVATCAADRGELGATCAWLHPDRPDALARAVALRRELEPRGALEPLLDVHVVRRALGRWASFAPSTHPDGAWDLVVQNRGRLRARARAVVGEHARDALGDRLLALPALHARTVAGLARFAWSWAWQQLSVDFAFDDGRGASPRCEAPTGLRPLPEEALDSARAWVLLVILRGRWSHLRRWVREGGTGDRDSGWGRLLSDELPPDLKDPGGGYRRLRALLADNLGDLVDEVLPVVRDVAGLPAGRDLARAATARLASAWHPSVELPRAGFPTMQEYTRAFLASYAQEESCAS